MTQNTTSIAAPAAIAPGLEANISPVNNAANSSPVIENKQEIIAAVCADVAEENGTDISAIRVVSFKKI